MKRPIVILFGILMLVLAACGGSADTGAADDGTTTTQATTTTADHGDDEGTHEDEGEHAAALEVLDSSTAADRTVEVTAKEFEFQPPTISVAKGEVVKFVVTNEGAIQHEFRITNEHAVAEHLEGGHEGHDEAMMPGQAMVMEGDLVVLVDPGQTVEVVVEFHEDADYDLVACLLPGHYEAGMHVPLELQG